MLGRLTLNVPALNFYAFKSREHFFKSKEIINLSRMPLFKTIQLITNSKVIKNHFPNEEPDI
jgi:hypothetical protein